MKCKKQGNRKGVRKDKGLKINPRVQVPGNYHWQLLNTLYADLKGYLSEDDCLLLETIIRNRDFESYSLLGDIWGLQSITPSSSGSAFYEIKARYCIASLLKKYLPKSDASLDAKALQKVLEAEEVCARFNRSNYKRLTWGSDDFAVGIFTHARSFLEKLLGTNVPVKAVCDGTRHGPGSNLDTCNGEVSAYYKYSSFPYSCTGPAVGYARFVIERDQRWMGALTDAYRERLKIPQHYPIDMREFWLNVFNVVDYNRITFVPKTAKISRSIAIEPTMNLMLQLGVDGVIRKRLKRWGVDLDSQEPNRYLSRVGSKSGLFSTIDLKAASDSISLGVCKALLPEDWYTFLCQLRAPKGVLSDDTSQVIEYEKMSSMGNGYTFALESAIFAALVYAAYKEDGIKPDFSQNCAVFGDDLIVTSEQTDSVIRALNLAGFTTNGDKTFSNGPVRESCGADWFNGLPIRPVFLSKPPKTVQDLYVDYNRIKRSLNLRFDIQSSKCLDKIISWIPKSLRLYGPCSDEVFDSWLHQSDKTGPWRLGMYNFTRLIKQPKKVRRVQNLRKYSFFFQKLMHNLKALPPTPFYENKSASGSRFTVLAKGYTVRQTPSSCSSWQDVYTEAIPMAASVKPKRLFSDVVLAKVLGIR